MLIERVKFKFHGAYICRQAVFICLCLAMYFVIVTTCAAADHAANASQDTAVHCSETWYRFIEEKLPTGDGQGHGPDLGSDEWKSVVEFKLGIRGMPGIPKRDSEAWCRHIDQVVRTGHPASPAIKNPGKGAKTGPSFPCDKVESGSIEAMICADKVLSALDRKLAFVYASASKKASNQYPPLLKAEQRGWIKGRNECGKSADKRGCVINEYEHRIAELQARYRLVSKRGPIRFSCDSDPANEVMVTFFHTNPPTLIAERGDDVSLMYLQPGESGSTYRGRNEIFRKYQGNFSITWGYGAPEMQCKTVP